MTRDGDGGDRGDAAQAALDHLLSDKRRVTKLNKAYEAQFKDDPIGVVERLLKLIPAKSRGGKTDGPPKVGLNIILSDERPTKRKK